MPLPEVELDEQLQAMVDAARQRLADEDHEGYWSVVHDLQREGSHDLALAMSAELRSESADERRLGADVLSQLGYPSGRPHLELALAALTAASVRETDAEVVDAIVAALGHQHDARALPGILTHIAHPLG